MSGPDQHYLESLLERASRTYGDGPLLDVRERTRAIVGAALGEDAARALDDLRHGRVPTARELAALEWSIRLLRPALLVGPHGQLPPLPAAYPEVGREFPHWDRLCAQIAPLLASIGRIDRVWDGQRRLCGTGFLVSRDTILTNRHVLDDLSFGSRMLSDDMATIHFRYEHGGSPQEQAVKITGVRAYSRTHDLALLEIPPQPQRAPIPIAGRMPDAGEAVVALGFPGERSERNPRFVDALFGSALGVKRGSPGRMLGASDPELTHDCSTLGGSSGSPLFSQERGDVVGVHFSGVFVWRNDAVPAPIAAAFVSANAA
jgi:S1-C subfamily serine protease